MQTDKDRSRAKRGKRESLTTRTNPRPSPEWDELPPWLPPLPPLRLELFDITSPDISAMLHCIVGQQHLSTLGDKHRLRPIRASTARECGVLDADSLVQWDDSRDAEGLVDDVLEVLTPTELRKGDVRSGGSGAELGEDDRAELCVHPRMSSKEVEDPSEQCAGGVPARG